MPCLRIYQETLEPYHRNNLISTFVVIDDGYTQHHLDNYPIEEWINKTLCISIMEFICILK